MLYTTGNLSKIANGEITQMGDLIENHLHVSANLQWPIIIFATY